MTASPPIPDTERARIQRRTVAVLGAGQVLGGVAFGATLSLGAVLAADVSGDDALSGLATAAVTLGTAAVAIPLAALARRAGRRVSLTTGTAGALAGVVGVIVAASFGSFPFLLAAFILIGAGQAANLQSRFAAADLATDATRGRDLSLVVWATTVGAVLGPNLAGPGETVGAALGMPPLTGAYVFTIVAQVLAIVLYLSALRPDPLALAIRLDTAATRGSGRTIAGPDRPGLARYAIFAVAASHVVMVSVMAMTPVHLLHHGADLVIVGLTLSLHIAGMYAAAPLFGILADRWGRVRTILLGQGILASSLVLASVGSESTSAVTVALVLLGLGWSAATVSGAALLTEASTEDRRTRRQGISDFAMSFVGALGAIGAGIVLSAIGYGGLALVVGLAVIATTVLAVPVRTDRVERVKGRAGAGA
ncbi:MAG: MFS transporter [Microbacterium aurantiacum]|uniref:MFS transporter n=1 Tax=Microbacterium aurantiacum TaxID=162393 RepID=UPI0040367248